MKNVTDAARHSFIEREMHDINLEDHMIMGKDKLLNWIFQADPPWVQ